MKKINCISLDSKNEINFNNYFIFPYYNEKNLTYISINKDQIKWYNNNLKEITPFKRINKSLLYFYNNSKFKGYEIFVIGFINKIQKFKSFAVFDLLLKDEIDGKIQSKKYSIRYENINYRFLVNIPKSIKNIYSIFAQKFSESFFNNGVITCLKTNKWEGYSLYIDKPYNYENLSLISNKAWIIDTGKIIDIKISIDDKNNFIIDSLITKNNIKVTMGLDQIKIKNLDDLNDIKEKNIMYKTCNIDNILYAKFICFC